MFSSDGPDKYDVAFKGIVKSSKFWKWIGSKRVA